MILILGKGLTADYTNNADGEGIEMDDESISAASKVEYQVRIDFRNPCYPRNPWLNLFSNKRSHFRHRHRSDRFLQNWSQHCNGVVPKPTGHRPLSHRLGGDGMGMSKIGILT